MKNEILFARFLIMRNIFIA